MFLCEFEKLKKKEKKEKKRKKMLMLLCEPRIEVLFGYVNVFCFHLLKILLSLWSFLTCSL